MALDVLQSNTTKLIIIRTVTIFLIGFFSLHSFAISGKKKNHHKPSEIDWSLQDEWLKQETRCHPLVQEIKEAGLDIHEIAFPSKTPPKNFRSHKLNELFNEFLFHVQNWLEIHNFHGDPVIRGHESGILPENSKTSIRNYITRNDPLLIPALTHLIFIAQHKQLLHKNELQILNV